MYISACACYYDLIELQLLKLIVYDGHYKAGKVVQVEELVTDIPDEIIDYKIDCLTEYLSKDAMAIIQDEGK